MNAYLNIKREAERTARQRLDPIIKDSHMMVLAKVQSGESLDWLERSVLKGITQREVGLSEEVEQLVQQLKDSGKL